MTHIEKPNNIIAEQADVLIDEVNDNIQEELSEDMEVMGPGQILSDARKKMGLTQQDVADKLNFRKTLVNQIESEEFDTSLPETFNRGYLRNYAKLVNVSQEDVMVSYEQLNVAKTQASELQSFSKGTEKLAENNRIMWISYCILAILIGSTVVWWMQNNTEQEQVLNDVVETTSAKANDEEKSLPDTLAKKTASKVPAVEIESADININTETLIAPSSIELNQEADITNSVTRIDEIQASETNTAKSESASVTETSKPEGILTKLTFTFSGDCWVNISDATGERIAWGVKKLGYVMNISGQAPFNVTLGKPELVTIYFADEIIDMSQFNVGNIAKFTLPIAN